MKKNEAEVGQIERTEGNVGQTEGTDGQFESLQGQTEGNIGQSEGVKATNEATTDATIEGETIVSNPNDQIVGQSQGERKRKGKEIAEPDESVPQHFRLGKRGKMIKQKKKTRYNPKTERLDEYLTDDSERTLSESDDEEENPLVRSKLETTSQSDPKGKEKEIVTMSQSEKGKEHIRVDQPEDTNPSVILAKQLQAQYIEEEKQRLKEEQERTQADQEMSVKIQQEQARWSFIQQYFQRRRWKRSITHLESYMDNGKLICKCSLEGGEIRTVQADRLYTLGLEEWKQIANMSVRLKSEELKAYVKKEAIYNVNTAHFTNKIDDDEFREFCIAHNCHIGAKSLGLETQKEHPVPSGLVFKNKSYIRTDKHEGLFYKDCSGAECFQDINSLYNSSLYHCIALLNECKKDRCLPFRVRLTSCLFNNLLRIKQIGGVDDKIELIKKEFQRLHNKTDEEMEKLIKWKFERSEWVKSSLKQSILQAPPKKQRRRR